MIGLFTKEKLKFALHNPRETLADPSVLGDAKPMLLFEPGFVRRDEGRWINDAADGARAGLPVALGSGGVAGSAYIALHASHGIRYGLDPQAALAAITSVPAEMFGLADRVGSLAKGLDGDLVVFDGDPFEPTSRVQLVVVGGEVVFDGRDNNNGSNR